MTRGMGMMLLLHMTGMSATTQDPDHIFADGFEPETGSRVGDPDLRDPHGFANFIGCRDVASTSRVVSPATANFRSRSRPTAMATGCSTSARCMCSVQSLTATSK